MVGEINQAFYILNQFLKEQPQSCDNVIFDLFREINPIDLEMKYAIFSEII